MSPMAMSHCELPYEVPFLFSQGRLNSFQARTGHMWNLLLCSCAFALRQPQKSLLMTTCLEASTR
jgi:hypothetical protein